MKYRQRHVDTMPPTGRVVAELVNAENGEERGRVRNADHEVARTLKQVDALMKGAGPDGRQDGGEKQQRR